jgi:hypothetical protein
MYRGIIEHRLSLTVYLRNQILNRKLEQPTGLGRIYRVVHDTTPRDTRKTLSEATPSQMVDLLSDSSGWWRDTAQRLLVERADRLRAGPAGELSRYGQSVVAKLKTLAMDAKDWRTRSRALWTLYGIDAIEPAIVERALEDRSGYLRASAVRLTERWIGEDDGSPFRAAIL